MVPRRLDGALSQSHYGDKLSGKIAAHLIQITEAHPNFPAAGIFAGNFFGHSLSSKPR
jgi:hypothetical protein